MITKNAAESDNYFSRLEFNLTLRSSLPYVIF